MSLIPCPECGEMISDKADKCVHCGAEIKMEQGKIFCPECGAELENGSDFCSRCGCPVDAAILENGLKDEASEQPASEITQTAGADDETKGKNPKSRKKALIFAIIAIVLVIIIVVVAVISVQSSRTKAKSEQYLENFEIITTEMLLGAAQAETSGNLIKSVWYNCIFEEKDSDTDVYTRENDGYGDFYEDFNDALANLFSDSDFIEDMDYIEDIQDEVASMMKEMQNPPEEYEEAYDVLEEAYDVFYEFTSLVVSPSGSYTTFSSNFSELDSDFATYYNKLTLYYED